MKTFNCLVTLKESINNVEAKNEAEFIDKVKDIFYEEYNIQLEDYEITEIKGVSNED